MEVRKISHRKIPGALNYQGASSYAKKFSQKKNEKGGKLFFLSMVNRLGAPFTVEVQDLGRESFQLHGFFGASH